MTRVRKLEFSDQEKHVISGYLDEDFQPFGKCIRECISVTRDVCPLSTLVLAWAKLYHVICSEWELEN